MLAGSKVLYLPPYSPDYNPIELSFSVLRAWVKRHYHAFWPIFEGDFCAFLRHAIQESECDRFAIQHFRFSGTGYIFEGDIDTFNRELSNTHYGLDNLLTSTTVTQSDEEV